MDVETAKSATMGRHLAVRHFVAWCVRALSRMSVIPFGSRFKISQNASASIVPLRKDQYRTPTGQMQSVSMYETVLLLG